MRITAAAVLAGSVVAVVLGMPVRANQPQKVTCLHGDGESAAEAARRKAAVQFVRAVNTEENEAMEATGQYQPLATLNLPATPDGFLLAFGESVAGYIVVLKDTYDPCSFALFSDQEGLIYTGQPLR